MWIHKPHSSDSDVGCVKWSQVIYILNKHPRQLWHSAPNATFWWECEPYWPESLWSKIETRKQFTCTKNTSYFPIVTMEAINHDDTMFKDLQDSSPCLLPNFTDPLETLHWNICCAFLLETPWFWRPSWKFFSHQLLSGNHSSSNIPKYNWLVPYPKNKVRTLMYLVQTSGLPQKQEKSVLIFHSIYKSSKETEET